MNGGMRVAAYEKSKSVKLKSISTMTEGTIWRQIFLFSIPLILGNLLQQMYNTVDSIIVGNFVGSNALAAVGSSTSLICLLIAFSMGASAGAGVIVSQFYGAGDENGVQRSAHTALMLALILGIVLTIAGIVFSPAILRWMRTPEEVMNQSVLYLRIYSYGLVFNVIYNICAPAHPARNVFYPQMARLLGLEPPQFRNSLDSGKGKIIDGSRICNELGFEYQYPDPLVMPLE